jgi:hypothetical protein
MYTRAGGHGNQPHEGKHRGACENRVLHGVNAIRYHWARLVQALRQPRSREPVKAGTLRRTGARGFAT